MTGWPHVGQQWVAIFTWLIEITGSSLAPSFYYMAVAIVSLIAVLFARRRYGAH